MVDTFHGYLQEKVLAVAYIVREDLAEDTVLVDHIDYMWVVPDMEHLIFKKKINPR